MIREYRTIQKVADPIMVVSKLEDVTCGELAEVTLTDGTTRLCKVLETNGDAALVMLYGGAAGVNLQTSKVRFLGRTHKLALSGDILGRVFDGMGRPADGGPELFPESSADINGVPVSPAERVYPGEVIHTGVSAIDGVCPLTRGQTLALFSCAGLPHARLAARLARSVISSGNAEGGTAVVFAAIGISYEESESFVSELTRAGAIESTVVFTNLAGDSAFERIAAPRAALTAAEYLAFERDMDVLVILSDMTRYGDALREVSAARQEALGYRSYPGLLHAELAAIYERAGLRRGKSGSITLLPILTMPGDDITHPVADAAGHAADGQIVLSRELHVSGISPPIDVLSSQSRTARGAIDADVTYALLASYARGKKLRARPQTPGARATAPAVSSLLEFASELEQRFIAQGDDAPRSTQDTRAIASELHTRLSATEQKGETPE
jgi:V/A-type H+-transporting ATPase subunit B